MVASVSEILTTLQNGVAAANNLAQLLSGATLNSSSLRIALASTYFIPSSAASGFAPSSAAGTVTTINTSVGLIGGPITVSGTLAVSLTTLTNSLSSDRAISSAGTYRDGPQVAQGTSGVWLATGNITFCSTFAGNTNIFAKLWDGTAVIDSGNVILTGTGLRNTMSLSGVITSPSGDIRISAADPDLVPAVLEANRTGTGKDCTITVVRIG